jgi:macrodomain Ter protein organizer (MatP/YcbG family)
MQRAKIKKRLKSSKKTTRVTVDMPFEKHKRLKAVAALNGETLQEFILTCVDEKIHKPSAKSKLEQLEELGLFAGTERTDITSTNYKAFIKKSLKAKYEK